MTAAIFGLLGVIVGGLLSGVVAYVVERRRELRQGIVAGRLVSHELLMIVGDFELWANEGHGAPQHPISHLAWLNHRATLARVLPAPDWEMVEAAYTWIELYNDHPTEIPLEDGGPELTEMNGGVKSLFPLVEGKRPRVGLGLRWRRWRSYRRQRRANQ